MPFGEVHWDRLPPQHQLKLYVTTDSSVDSWGETPILNEQCGSLSCIANFQYPNVSQYAVHAIAVRDSDGYASPPSNVLFRDVPEASIFASLMCGVLLLEGLRRRKNKCE